MECLCKKCATWVDCGKKNNKPKGFCLQEDLFTYTSKTKCSIYLKGKPLTEKEYENYNTGA